jgi:hypothetical protein
MTTMRTKRPTGKSLAFGAMIATLFVLGALAPRSGNAQLSCALEVYDYCFSQGRNVDPNNCECNPMSCLGLPASDCTEQGMYLNYGSCTCVSNPGYVFVCDIDPYAYGCPRSFDTVFGNQLRTRGGDPLIGGGDGDICSFSSYAWCNVNNGSWSSYGCACSGLPSTSAQTACESNGGTWYDPGASAGGPACYNPSGYGATSQCASGTGSLYSCVASGGRWNPYICTCTP